MIEFLSYDDAAQTFTLAIDGAERTYPDDKEGKRQAILDGLATLETVTVGEDVYLPGDAALQVVATVLYPAGVETEGAYRTLRQLTEKACAHAGYGEEVELGPPQVPFSARGRYRRRHPPVDAGLVADELARAGVSSLAPWQEVDARIVWNKVAWAANDRPWSGLTAAQQARIRTQVDAVADAEGWEREMQDNRVTYVRPLAPDLDEARAAIVQCIGSAAGRPVRAVALARHAERGAYGRAFYSDDLAPALADLVRAVLAEKGYETEPDDGAYRPRPLVLPGDAEARLREALDGVAPVQTTFGPALLLEDVLAAARPGLGGATLGEWQVKELLATGVLGRVLAARGVQREPTWCQPYHFAPDDGEDPPAEACQVLLQEVRVRHDPDRTLSLADGLAVYTPAVVLDPEEETVVYLEMVGAKQSVRANWAALVGGQARWLLHNGRRRKVALNGMKAHVQVQTALPCGWHDAVLLHKQASLAEMSPEAPFYLLDDGARDGAAEPAPTLFYPMLNKCLAVPVLAAWAGTLWARGREAGLIHLLGDGAGQGYAAWQVLPDAEAWQRVVQEGLAADVLSF